MAQSNEDQVASRIELAWDVLQGAAESATDECRSALAAAGISAVFERDGELLEQLPDGTVRPLKSADSARDG